MGDTYQGLLIRKNHFSPGLIVGHGDEYDFTDRKIEGSGESSPEYISGRGMEYGRSTQGGDGIGDFSRESHGSELKKVKKAKLEREGFVCSRTDGPIWNLAERVVLGAGRFHYLGVRFRRVVPTFLRSHYASEAFLLGFYFMYGVRLP
jgi:hypothetical protein